MTDAVKMAIEALRWIVEREKSASSAAALEMARAATDALDKIAALEQAGEPHVLQDGFEAEYDDDAFTIRFPIGYAITARASGDMIVTRYPKPDDWKPIAVNVTEIQRVGQEFDEVEPDAWRHGEQGFCWRTFDSKETASSWGMANGIRTEPIPLYAHPPQSRVAAEPVGLREADQ